MTATYVDPRLIEAHRRDRLLVAALAIANEVRRRWRAYPAEEVPPNVILGDQ